MQAALPAESLAERLQPRQLLGRRVFQHRRKVPLRLLIPERLLFLSDEVPVGPVHRRRFQLSPREQSLIAVVEIRSQSRPAPPVKHRMMEADYKLETLLGPEKDVDLPQPPSFPVEDAPLVSFSPFRQIPLLLLGRLLAQVFYFQRQFNPAMHDLQWALPFQAEPGSQDRLFLDT